MASPQQAPIFTTTWDFSVWLLKKARAAPQDPLAQTLASHVLRLLDAVTLALKNIDRDEALQEADIILIWTTWRCSPRKNHGCWKRGRRSPTGYTNSASFN